jgi:phosphonopyruvate decarboxylase
MRRFVSSLQRSHSSIGSKSAFTSALCSRSFTAPSPHSELVRDFLDPALFYDDLKAKDLDFFTGVPDSLLKDFCAYVTTNSAQEDHVLTVNEGHAIALAAGYHLATGKIPVVYMQNSGLGNAVNPLL